MPDIRRRSIISTAPALLLAPTVASARPLDYALNPAQPYSLTLKNLHTSEKFKLEFAENFVVGHELHQRFNKFLRDHYSGDATTMDPELLVHLTTLQRRFDIDHGYFEVISGYRSPKTNEMLRSKGRRVSKNSMHMSGQAIDIRLGKVKLKKLRDAALDLKAGGVGYYARSQFLHFDTGRVRFW